MDVTSTIWALLGLGAWHGLNPGMGWLFAVALGLQEQRGGAVARALVPIALGHLLAIGVIVFLAIWLGAVLPLDAVRLGVAVVLIGLGGYHLARHVHPRWVRMRVGPRDLTIWSFLVALVHGAGVMVVPVLLGGHRVEAASHALDHHRMAPVSSGFGLLAVLIHTAAYLASAGLVAWIVYRKVGLAFLRHAWINVDQIWAAALILTGVVTLTF